MTPQEEEPHWPVGTKVRHRHTKETGVVVEVIWDADLWWFDHVVEFYHLSDGRTYRLRYLYTSLEEADE